MDARDGPIGVFDSGVGGLAVLWELRRLLPAEDLLYFADQAHFPYGVRPRDEVQRLLIQASRNLLADRAKLLVVACNTASSAALLALRGCVAVPVVGIEPAVKPACALTRRGRIGVLATAGTVQGIALRKLIERVAGGVEVTTVAAQGLVELVERGGAGTEQALRLVDEALAPLREAEVDVVVLGCTHYSFLKRAVERAMGPGVAVLEPAAAVARHASSVLRSHGLAAPAGHTGSTRYRSTLDDEALAARAALLRCQADLPDTGWAARGNVEV